MFLLLIFFLSSCVKDFKPKGKMMEGAQAAVELTGQVIELADKLGVIDNLKPLAKLLTMPIYLPSNWALSKIKNKLLAIYNREFIELIECKTTGDILLDLIDKAKKEADRHINFNQEIVFGNGCFSYPIHIAVANSTIDVVKVLIEKGADVNLCDNEERHSLWVAVEAKKSEIAKYLLKPEAFRVDGESIKQFLVSRDKPRKDGLYPIHVAVLKRDLEMSRAICDKEKVIKMCDTQNGLKPIHYATINTEPNILKDIMESYADSENLQIEKILKEKDKHGRTILHLGFAVRNVFVYQKVFDYAKSLDDNTAKQNIFIVTDSNGANCLHYLAFSYILKQHKEDNKEDNVDDQKSILDLVYFNESTATTFTNFFDFYDEEKREEVENLKKLIYKRDTKGYTPLHYAVQAGDLELCRILVSKIEKIETNTQANVFYDKPCSPLLGLAYSTGQLKIVDFFVGLSEKLKVILNIKLEDPSLLDEAKKNSEARTIVDCFSRLNLNNSTDITENQGVEVDENKKKNFLEQVMAAKSKEDLHEIARILGKTAYLNDLLCYQDEKDRKTAMHLAVHSKDLLKMLYSTKKNGVKNGYTQKDRFGNTPLHCAVVDENLESILVIKEFQTGEINEQNINDATPLDLALRQDFEPKSIKMKCIKELIDFTDLTKQTWFKSIIYFLEGNKFDQDIFNLIYETRNFASLLINREVNDILVNILKNFIKDKNNSEFLKSKINNIFLTKINNIEEFKEIFEINSNEKNILYLLIEAKMEDTISEVLKKLNALNLSLKDFKINKEVIFADLFDNSIEKNISFELQLEIFKSLHLKSSDLQESNWQHSLFYLNALLKKENIKPKYKFLKTIMVSIFNKNEDEATIKRLKRVILSREEIEIDNLVNSNYDEVLKFLFETWFYDLSTGIENREKENKVLLNLEKLIRNNKIKLLKEILESKTDCFSRIINSEKKLEMLFKSLEIRDESLVEYFLEKKFCEINQKDKEGFTLLMKSVILSNKNAVKFLVRQGADLNLENHNKKTALSLSLEENDKSGISKFLLEQPGIIKDKTNQVKMIETTEDEVWV